MPGSSNFLQFNPTLANQESDATYAGDAIRSGGITTNVIMSSLLGNKLFYQLSIFVAAFAQMLANKGYTVSDANFTNLVNTFSNIITFNITDILGFTRLLTRNPTVASHTGTTTNDTIRTLTVSANVLTYNSIKGHFCFVSGPQGGIATIITVTWGGTSYSFTFTAVGVYTLDLLIIKRTTNLQAVSLTVVGPAGFTASVFGLSTQIDGNSGDIVLKAQSGANSDVQQFQYAELYYI